MDRRNEQLEEASFIRRQLILFFVLAYTIAWMFFGALGLSRAGIGWIPFELPIPIMTVLGSFAPSLAALLTLRFTESRWPAPDRFRTGSPWSGDTAGSRRGSGTEKEVGEQVLSIVAADDCGVGITPVEHVV